ncbi:calcineurin B homologous protein 2 [Eucyclogobius newberryi]|uniref:calcineurin B homologous protein 2 n=1 Tax=Eucyclogobius newberryi TaxID=166745 RepID=UPI003B5B19AC
MGSNKSSVQNVPDVQELIQETGFSASHLQRLYERFHLLDRDQMGRLRVQDFEAIPELAGNPIGDRIIGAFFYPGKDSVDFHDFVRVLAHFQPTDSNTKRKSEEVYNSPNRKLQFAFQLYDQDQDGKISRAELLQVLQELLGIEVTDEQLQSIAERAIKEADLDQDDAISFEEFKKSLEKVDVNRKMRIGFLS